MSFDPVLFDSPMFEAANEAVLFCTVLLEQRGLSHLASGLHGLGAVTSPVMGRLARTELVRLQAKASNYGGHVQEVVSIALDAVDRALGIAPLKAVS